MINRDEVIPSPDSYTDWKSWASQLVNSLSTKTDLLELPVFIYNEGKSRKGLPVGTEGDAIWLRKGSDRFLAIHNGRAWNVYEPTGTL